MKYIKQRRYKKYSYGAFYIKERCEAKELGGRAFCIRIFYVRRKSYDRRNL